ncbi:hypothetical protein IT413_03625 [Candidatus Peregrinibacteria bacterium]|nr:hypothetical protein [Candidatus Peregrinibacteria bacterium]
MLVSAVALTIAVPSLVNADPAGSPPGGNVDANFNTVTSNSVTAGGGYFVQADITNWLYNSGGTYGGSVAVNDPNGFISTGTSLVAGTFQGGTKGVDGSCNVGACAAGYFSATGAGGVGVSASSTNGVAGTFNGTNGGVSVTTTNFNAGDFTTFDPSSYALISSGSNNFRGKILNTDASVNGGRVQISDDNGFRIANTAGSAQFDVSGTTGDISDPVGAVTVKDDNGLELWRAAGGSADITLTPAVPPRLTTNHNLTLNLNSGNGTMFFMDGLNNATLGMNQWGIYNAGVGPSPSFSPQPLKIIDSEGLGISDNAGNVRLLIDDTGDISDLNSDVMITDNMQSTGYIASGWDGTLADTSFAAIYNNGAMYGTGAIWNSPTMGGLTLNAISPGGMTLNSCLNHTDTTPANGQCDTISGNAGFTINTQSGGQTINATTGGFTVNATSGGIALNSDTGGIANQKAGLPVRVQDNLEVSGSTLVSGNIDLRTWLYDGSDWLISVFGDFNATGKITATSIGSYYYRYSGVASRTSGAWVGCDSTTTGGATCILNAYCDGTDPAVDVHTSWMINGTTSTYQLFDYLSDSSGSVYMTSAGIKPDYWRIRVKCFDTNV